MINLQVMGSRARDVTGEIALANSERRDAVLNTLADGLSSAEEEILAANQIDLSSGKSAGLSEAILDRLMLTPSRLSSIAADLRSIARLPDPLGQKFDERILPNGLEVCKIRVPLGVIGVIYEARPNVTLDIAGLAIKTGNAAILRGGSETINSNLALIRMIRQSLEENGLPADVIQFIDRPDRALVTELLRMHQYIDMLIPRGGASLHAFCRENSSIPVITGGIGICHLFVDESARFEEAFQVIRNAKIQRPSVCNALDTALVHRAIAREFIPGLITLLEKDGVKIHVHEAAVPYLVAMPKNMVGAIGPTVSDLDLGSGVVLAEPEDFDVEWLSLDLGLKVVDGLGEAIEHIKAHSTGHSDGILTDDIGNADRFVTEVDSAAVYVNASTRFTDGGQLGLGAEVAVSTQRLHARGPMGLTELTTYKWVIRGNYHVRE